jgi:hypothetical protein
MTSVQDYTWTPKLSIPLLSGLFSIVVPESHRIRKGHHFVVTPVRDCTRTIKPSDPPFGGLFFIVVPDLHRILEYLVDIRRSGLYPHNQTQRPAFQRTVFHCRSGFTPDSGDI